MRYTLLVLAAAAAAVALAACVPTSVLPRLHALEGIIEEQVDAIIDEKEDRRCKWPVDILERTVDRRGAAWFDGWLESCPAAARLFRSAAQ